MAVDSDLVAECRENIRALEPEIKNIVKEEVVEKELRKAEMLN